MRGVPAAVLLALVLSGLCGCGPGDIGKVRVGMTNYQVEDVMGKPEKVIRGDGADVEMQTWVYRQGRVHFKKFQVVLVERAGEGPTITQRVREQQRREKEGEP